MIHIGFTGTREGMSPAQAQQLYDHLMPYAEADEWAFHHGDCQGADAEAHRIAWLLGAMVYVHPPDVATMRAYCAGPSRVRRHAPLPYLVRNRAIVDACDLLIAAPLKPEKRDPRSGTWATIRYARKHGTPVYLLPREEQCATHKTHDASAYVQTAGRELPKLPRH